MDEYPILKNVLRCSQDPRAATRLFCNLVELLQWRTDKFFKDDINAENLHSVKLMVFLNN